MPANGRRAPPRTGRSGRAGGRERAESRKGGEGDGDGEHPLASEAEALETQADRPSMLTDRMDDVRESMERVSERLAGTEVATRRRPRASPTQAPRASREPERGDDGLPSGDGPAPDVDDLQERLEGNTTSVRADATERMGDECDPSGREEE